MSFVTVIIPTRDRWHLVGRAVESALRQKGCDVEVLVVDDGSLTGPVRASWLASVRVLRHDVPLGVAEARNSGLHAARAPFVAFLDDDDYWAPAKLQRQLVSLSETGAAWGLTSAVVVDARLRPIGMHRAGDGEALVRSLRSFNSVPGGCSTVMARTDAVRDVGGFDPAFSMVADWDLWLRLSCKTEPAVVREPLAAYVRHPQSMTSRPTGALAEVEKLYEKHRRKGIRPPMAPNWGVWQNWLAERERAAGFRLRAAARWGRLGVLQGSPRALWAAANVLLLPNWADCRALKESRALFAEFPALKNWLEIDD